MNTQLLFFDLDGTLIDTMREYAQECDESVLWSHVDLYVNERTLEFGEEGRQALQALSRLARERGLLGASRHLQVWGHDR